MRTLSTLAMATFIGLVISGCSGQKMMEAMDSGMSSMDTPMEKSMKDEKMMKDTATESMKPDMKSMQMPMEDNTMMDDTAAKPMKSEAETMDNPMQ